jgi:uncharacterized delta-60 repeat protein
MCQAAALYPQAGTANDGKIVLEGSKDVDISTKKNRPIFQDAVALARFNTNGTLDTTFGNGGEVTTLFSIGSVTSRGVVITSDGKIVVAADNGMDCVLARYNANGSLDTTFGTGGTVITGFTSGTYEENLAQQSDGKLVVVGESGSNWQLVRYNANGTLDASFGSGGIVVTPAGSTTPHTLGVAIYPTSGTTNDGKIVVAVTTGPSNSPQLGLNRYNPNGSLDTTWGGSGEVITPFSSTYVGNPGGIAIQSDGKVVASVPHALNAQTGTSLFALTRYNSDGSQDNTFGTNGEVTTQFGTVGTSSDPYGVTIQSNGDIVLAGLAFSGTNGSFAVARYLPSEPQIGSLTASRNPITSGSSVTLTASNIADGNPGANITQVAFYVQINGSNTLLGYGTQQSPGIWVFTFTVNLPAGTYNLFAQAEDSYGVYGDLFGLSLIVQ